MKRKQALKSKNLTIIKPKFVKKSPLQKSPMNIGAGCLCTCWHPPS